MMIEAIFNIIIRMTIQFVKELGLLAFLRGDEQLDFFFYRKHEVVFVDFVERLKSEEVFLYENQVNARYLEVRL
jgi:hypothetical protein